MKINRLIIIIFVFFWFGACSPQAKIPPVIPSVESLNFDFSYFEQNIVDDTHFAYAVGRVNTWQSLLQDSINIHSTILNETSYNDFKFQKDETWLMDYRFNIEEVKYVAKFFGIIEPDTLFFNTFLSFNEDTLLFLEGTFYNESKTGQWFLNNEGINEEGTLTLLKFMSVDWNLDSLNQKEIKFTNNQIGLNNLNYLLYKDSIDSQYNSYVNIYESGTDNHSIIEWNNTTKTGRIKDPLHFNDENWHCWDENYIDTDCNIE